MNEWIYQAERLAELEEQREAEEKEEEEANNPMLVWKLHRVLFLHNDCHTLMHSLMMFQLKVLSLCMVKLKKILLHFSGIRKQNSRVKDGNGRVRCSRRNQRLEFQECIR